MLHFPQNRNFLTVAGSQPAAGLKIFLTRGTSIISG
jgi:hypothetical protein